MAGDGRISECLLRKAWHAAAQHGEAGYHQRIAHGLQLHKVHDLLDKGMDDGLCHALVEAQLSAEQQRLMHRRLGAAAHMLHTSVRLAGTSQLLPRPAHKGMSRPLHEAGMHMRSLPVDIELLAVAADAGEGCMDLGVAIDPDVALDHAGRLAAGQHVHQRRLACSAKHTWCCSC